MKDYVINHYSATTMGLKNPSCERSFGPSLTVPGQTLPLRQLVERYIRGGDVEVFSGFYDEGDDIPDNIERMSEIERLDYARDLKRSIDEYRKPISKDVSPVDVVATAPPPVQVLDAVE